MQYNKLSILRWMNYNITAFIRSVNTTPLKNFLGGFDNPTLRHTDTRKSQPIYSSGHEVRKMKNTKIYRYNSSHFFLNKMFFFRIVTIQDIITKMLSGLFLVQTRKHAL